MSIKQHKVGQCKGWDRGRKFSFDTMCLKCHTLKTEATVREGNWTLLNPHAQPAAYVAHPTPINYATPEVRPPCIHLGTFQSACACGDKLRNVHACNSEKQQEFDACWRSPLWPAEDKKHVGSCERCEWWVDGSPTISTGEIAELLGIEKLWTVVINLDRRPDRCQWFKANCRIEGVERFSAVDAKNPTEPMPEWWRAGKGAWGCQLSHRDVIRKAIANRVDAVMVFEDDAVFGEGFADKARKYLEAVPKDWQQVYLGGQHLRAALPVNPQVVRAFNVNRAHAYLIRGESLQRFSNHLDYCNQTPTAKQHVDYRYGALHPQIQCYAPVRWLVGQRGGISDIGKSVAETRFWH